MHKNNMNKNKPLKNKKEALEYCSNKGFSKEESKSMVKELWDYCSENDLKPTIDELDREIGYFLEEKEYKKQKEEWKNRSIWKKIVFDNNRRLRGIIIFFMICSLFASVVGIVKSYFLLRTYYIGKECPLGTEPSWLKRSCVEVVCNGDALEKGMTSSSATDTIDKRMLYFLNTFIYDPSVSKCVSKCAKLDAEYYQNFVRDTKQDYWKNRSYYGTYYYWKDDQCTLLPRYKNTFKDIELELGTLREDQVIALKNKELADKIKQEEDALKQYFLRILEENKEYYKKARYNH
jgi:hypothetical protein